MLTKKLKTVDVFRRKVKQLQQRSLVEIKRIDAELGRLKTEDETITIPKVQRVNAKIDYSILFAEEENEQADGNQTKLRKADEGPRLPVTNTQMKESSQDQKEPKEEREEQEAKEEKGKRKSSRRRTIQKNVVLVDGQEH